MNALMKNPLCLLLFVCLINTEPAMAQDQEEEKRPLEVEDVLAIKTITEAKVSPDGQWVAFVAIEHNLEENKRNSEVWIVNPYGPTTTRLTEDLAMDANIQWSPDGEWIAFISDRDSLPQVFGVSPEGGGAYQVTDFPTGVSAFRIAPNGEKIAILAKPEKTEEQEEMETDRGRPIVWDNYYDDEWQQLWVASLSETSAGEFAPYTAVGQYVTDVFWSPDSDQLVFSAQPTPGIRTFLDTDIYIISEPQGGRQLTSMPGAEYPVSWTEEHGLIVRGTNQRLWTVNQQLWQVDVNNGIPLPLTSGIDENANFVAITEDFLYVETAYKTFRRLYKIPVRNGNVTGAQKIISDDKMYYRQFTISEDAEKVAFIGERFDQSAQIYSTRTEDFKPQQATELNPELSEIEFGEQRVVTWRSDADGESIEGVLTLPVGYQRGDRVPMLVVIHGGPSGVSSNRFFGQRGAYPLQVFAGRGYAVFQPNYRGSTGYGQRFRSLNLGDISGRDWEDINSGVDEMIKQGYADAEQLGIMGWSFGGHHTFWGITQTGRFRAASAGAGANDLISMYSQTDLPEFYDIYLGSRPWEDFALFEERSAYRQVTKVTTPLLIQVGENDERVPAEQSIQFYEAVRSIGNTETELIIYPGQGHGVREPRLVKDLLLRNLEWFERWIPLD